MNLFASNPCPIKSTHEQATESLIKMTVESAQLLSTAHVVLDG